LYLSLLHILLRFQQKVIQFSHGYLSNMSLKHVEFVIYFVTNIFD